MVHHVDVVADLLEASASLAGLALVFLGMIASTAAATSPGETGLVLRKARSPVYATMSAFVAGILCVATATIWLVTAGSTALYRAVIVLFFVQLASLFAATSWSIRRLLREPSSSRRT